MKIRIQRAALAMMACLAGAFALTAQDWKTAESLAGVDLTGLTAAQRAQVLKILREDDCSCGCGMKMAECRVKDPKCYYSAGMATTIVGAVKQGKSDADARAAAAASPFAHGPKQEPTKLLDDAVSIPVAGSPVIGPARARIVLVEFSDFQCPYCAKAAPELHAVLKAYPADVKLIFKQYPLDTHPQAAFAAAAALAAHKQGKFWEIHDAMFSGNVALSRTGILAIAAKLGLDMKRFEADLDSATIRETVAKDVEDGDKVNVQGTPTLFIDGQKYNGPIELEALKPVLDKELKHPATVTKAELRKPVPQR